VLPLARLCFGLFQVWFPRLCPSQFKKGRKNMAHEPVATAKTEAWPDPQSTSSQPASAVSRLPGTPPKVDEALGRQMEREQQIYQVAEQIGAMLGKAVSGVRGFPDRVRKGLHVVKDQAREQAGSATDAASDLAQSMTERISGLRQEAAQTATQWREKAGERAGKLNQLAGEKIADARSRAMQATRENPIQMIIGFAAASFIIGFGLRLWRSNRG
jgi:hypothetical protein